MLTVAGRYGVLTLAAITKEMVIVVYVVSFCFLSIVLSRLLKNSMAGGA